VKESVEMAGLVWNLCRSGTLDQVKAALEAGADPNTTDEWANMWGEPVWTCLMKAVYDQRVDLVDVLLSQPSIDVNAKMGSGLDTALHTACLFSNEAILHKILATPGLLLNERNSTGDTPIMSAVRFGWVGAVKLMAAKEQVDLDVRGIEGRSLEEMGFHWENAECAQVVVEARRRRRLIREQKSTVALVLMAGLHDRGSFLSKLREPNDVRRLLMKKIWTYVTADWQVFDDSAE